MYRWERRDKKQESKRTRIKKHGKNIGETYRNAVLKREKKDKLLG